jgi:hypothetical protein
VVFLCSDRASHVNGHIMPIGGGWTARQWPDQAFMGQTTSDFEPGCMKLFKLETQERFSQIARNLPRSETVVALVAIRRDSCSINFPAKAFSHSQDP